MARGEPGRLGAHGRRGECGSVTAEFACVMPAVVMVLLLALGSFHVVTQQIRVSDAASAAARMLGRGDSDAAARSVVQRLVHGASLAATTEGRFVCATVSAETTFGPAGIAGLLATAQVCALADGL
jgi:Flp pilus assembly protein TadG